MSYVCLLWTFMHKMLVLKIVACFCHKYHLLNERCSYLFSVNYRTLRCFTVVFFSNKGREMKDKKDVMIKTPFLFDSFWYTGRQ